MRFGMSSVRGAGAPTPNHPVYMATTGTGLPQAGHYEIAPGSEVTSWVPNQPPAQPVQQAPMIRSGNECPPGTVWGPDPTGQAEFACVPISPTGDTSPARASSTGGTSSASNPPSPAPSPTTPRLPPILPTLRQVIPCAPAWVPRAYGGPNLKPPSLSQVPLTYLGAGDAGGGFHADLTIADVLSWGAFGLGLLLGQQVVENIYDRRRVA